MLVSPPTHPLPSIYVDMLTHEIDLWHLYVDPSTKQRGLGTLLMEWGLERVDAKGMASSVVSTPNAKDFYAKFGFAEISHADLDMAKIRGDFLGFGVWRQYGMLRPARPVGES